MLTKEQLLEKSKKPSADALKMHPFYRGKIASTLKCAVRDFQDFAIWYTARGGGRLSGYRGASRESLRAYQQGEYGGRGFGWNAGAGSGGHRPGGGDPGDGGKAILFKYLGGVDAWPICLDTKDPDDIIKTVKLISPCFGRHQPGRFLPTQVLLYSRYPPEGVQDSGLA